MKTGLNRRNPYRFKPLQQCLLFIIIAAGSLPTTAQDYVVNVHGIVCQFCSYGVALKIRKLDFINTEKLKKGVKVDIENQMVFIAVHDDAKLDKQALFDAIESGGYKPVKIWAITKSGERVEVEQ